jgi:tellurium resistance protein TerD
MSGQQGLVPTLNLSKGENLNLTKDNAALKNVGFALGWTTTQDNKGRDIDPDASALLLGIDGRLRPGTPANQLVWYQNLTNPGITHSGDDRTGKSGADCELISVNFEQVHQDVKSVLFVCTIHDEDKVQGRGDNKYNFGQVKNMFIRVFDLDTKHEILRFDLTEDYSKFNALIVGKLYRHNNDWKFSAMGEGKQGDLNTLYQMFLV